MFMSAHSVRTSHGATWTNIGLFGRILDTVAAGLPAQFLKVDGSVTPGWLGSAPVLELIPAIRVWFRVWSRSGARVSFRVVAACC